jgi:hypothetical protein
MAPLAEWSLARAATAARQSGKSGDAVTKRAASNAAKTANLTV